MTALDASSPHGLDHRGVVYSDRDSLVALAVPLITRALADGEPVVVVVDRATARGIDAALALDGVGVGVPGTPPITYPSPTALGGHGSPAFTTSLGAWTGGPARILVLTQYAPGPDDGIDPSLVGLPATLICACADDADPEVRRAFDEQHAALLAGAPAVDEPPTTVLETDLGGTGDLAGVRRDVRRVAVAAGFRGRELDRTVLAVHEACALGCRLLHGVESDGPAEPGRSDRRCRVTVTTGDGHLDADVVVPGAAGAAVPGPPGATDPEPGAGRDTVLGRVGRFCQTISMQDGARSRAIRVRCAL